MTAPKTMIPIQARQRIHVVLQVLHQELLFSVLIRTQTPITAAAVVLLVPLAHRALIPVARGSVLIQPQALAIVAAVAIITAVILAPPIPPPILQLMHAVHLPVSILHPIRMTAAAAATFVLTD